MENPPKEPTPDDPGQELASMIEEGVLLAGRHGTRFDRLVDVFLVLSGGLVLLAALAVTFNVISREALGRTYTWVFEYSELAVVFVVFLAIAGVARSDGHVRMDLIDEFLAERPRLRLTVATDALGALIALLLTVAGAWVTYQDLQAGTTIGLLNTPRWIALAIVPIGSAALFVEQLRAVRRALAGLR